jgi:tetratricopeptide (TPR) repeat protein
MLARRVRTVRLVSAILIVTGGIVAAAYVWSLTSPFFYQWRASTACSQGRLDDAIRMYSRALSVERTIERRPLILYRRALAYSAKHDLTHAIDDLNSAIGYRPSADVHGTLLRMRGLLRFAQCNGGDALRDIEEALKFSAPDSQIENARGVLLLQVAGDYERSMEAFDRALMLAKNVDTEKRAGRTAEVLCQRGNARIQLGQYEEAISDFNDALRLEESPQALLGRAWAKLAQADCKAAKKDAERVLEVQSEDNDPIWLLGRISLCEGRNEAANSFFQQMQTPLGRLVGSLALTDSLAAAQICLAAESNLDCAAAELIQLCAACAHLRGDEGQACDYYERSFQRVAIPNLHWVLYVLAAKNGRPSADAEATVMSALSRFPESLWVRQLNSLALGRVSIGDVISGLNGSSTQRTAEAFYIAGETELQRGNVEVAKEYFRETIKTASRCSDAYLLALNRLRALGKKEG